MAIALQAKSVDELLGEAAALQKARRLGEAEEMHRAVLARAPATLASLQFLSARCFERGELNAAEAYMRRCVALDPADLEACRVLGVVLEALGRVDEAVTVFRQAYRRRPSEPKTLLFLGAALAKAGQQEAAAAAGSLLEATVPETLQLDRLGGAAFMTERSARLRHALESFYAQLRADAVEEAKRAEPAADFSRVSRAVWRPIFGPGVAERRRPSFFYVPQLADEPWLEPERFDWAADLQAAAPELAKEVAGSLDLDADGLPYIGEHELSETWRSLAGRKDWSAVHFWSDALPNERALARFPKVRAALERLPLVTLGSTTPVEAFLSILKPRTRIPPHFGLANYRLTVHLPLIVPAGCGVAVAGEARETRFGRLMIFDDSYEHRAWNDSEAARIVLIFEIWHPALSAAERTAVAGMLSRYNRWTQRRHALLASGAPMPEKAEAELAARMRSIDETPDDSEAWLRLVECLVQQQRLEEAAQAASRGADRAPDIRRLRARADASPELRRLAVQADALIRQKLGGLHAEAIGPQASLRLRQLEWPPDDDGRLDLTTLSWQPALSRDETEALGRSASVRTRWLKARRLPPVEMVVDRWGRPVRELHEDTHHPKEEQDHPPMPGGGMGGMDG
jgi:aspartyl/asparaginyl beta-hydroxylase (cupin superfamily)